MRAPQCSLQHYLQKPGHGSSIDVHRQRNGERRCGTYRQWNITQPKKEQNHGLGRDMNDFLHLYKGQLQLRASLVAQIVKNLPATQETWVRSLGQEDTLEKRMATHSSVLAWRIHGQRSLAGYSP